MSLHRLSGHALLVLIAFIATPAVATVQLRVALTGNNAWTGRLAAPNRDQTDGPFATLERARDAIREVKRHGGLPPGGVIVELAGGTYERDNTFELTSEDSGEAEHPIAYRAAPGTEVRLVGGKAVNRLDESD